MKMQDQLKKAGYLSLALLLITAAPPAAGEDTGQTTTQEQPSEQPSKAAPETGTLKGEAVPVPTVSPAPESTQPPRGLRKIGNHWTPYQPPDPESFPEGAQVHIIVNGDTLWGLAGTHFQNPFLWPQIWNENRYIMDSHWIYPGDPLLLPPRPTVVSEIVPATGQTGSPAPPPPDGEAPGVDASEISGIEGEGGEMAQAILAPAGPEDADGDGNPPAADHSDLYCTGEVRAEYKKTQLYIANAEDVKIGLSTGDLVYLNGGKEDDRVHPGDSFLVIARESEVFHPLTDKWVGTYVRRLGRLKVLAVQDRTSIAEITESCQDRIEVGFEVEPDRVLSSPPEREVAFSKLDVEPSGKANGTIVHLQDGMNGALTGSMVDVDLGSRDGLHPGDVMLIYLNNLPSRARDVTYDYKWNNHRFQSLQLRAEDRHEHFPRKPIGQLMVISPSERTSSAKILYATRDVEVGDLVEVK